MIYKIIMLSYKLHKDPLIFVANTLKRIILLSLFLVLGYPLQAASHSYEENYTPRQGWFAGTHIGTQYYISEFNFKKSANMGYGFSTNLAGYFGKWINPLFALRASLELNNVTGGSVTVNKKKEKVEKELFHLFQTDLGLILDGGYLLRKEKTAYSLNPIISIGCAVNTTKKENGLTFSLGCINTWRINEHLRLNVETRFRFLEDNINGYNDKCDGEFILNAGCSYCF